MVVNCSFEIADRFPAPPLVWAHNGQPSMERELRQLQELGAQLRLPPDMAETRHDELVAIGNGFKSVYGHAHRLARRRIDWWSVLDCAWIETLMNGVRVAEDQWRSWAGGVLRDAGLLVGDHRPWWLPRRRGTESGGPK